MADIMSSQSQESHPRDRPLDRQALRRKVRRPRRDAHQQARQSSSLTLCTGPRSLRPLTWPGFALPPKINRITARQGWHGPGRLDDPRDAAVTQAMLEQWLPRDEWSAFCDALVGFGQEVCLDSGRRCSKCDVGKAGLCPSNSDIEDLATPAKRAANAQAGTRKKRAKGRGKRGTRAVAVADSDSDSEYEG